MWYLMGVSGFVFLCPVMRYISSGKIGCNLRCFEQPAFLLCSKDQETKKRGQRVEFSFNFYPFNRLPRDYDYLRRFVFLQTAGRRKKERKVNTLPTASDSTAYARSNRQLGRGFSLAPALFWFRLSNTILFVHRERYVFQIGIKLWELTKQRNWRRWARYLSTK